MLLSCPPQAREHRGVRALFWSPGREKIAANTQLAMLDKVATKDHRHQATARWTNTDTQRGRGGQADRTRDHTQADATHKCTHARTHARTHTHTRDTENTHIPRYENRQTNASHHGSQSVSQRTHRQEKAAAVLVLGVQHPFSEKSGVERRRIALPLVPCTPTRSHDKRDLAMKAETLRTACTHAQRALAPVHTHRTARQGLHTHKEGTRRPGSHPGTEQDSGCGCRRRKEKPPSCSEAAAAAHERGLRVVRLARASGGRQPHQHQRGRWHGWRSRSLSLSLSRVVCVCFHRRGRGPPTSSSSSCGGELPSQQFSMWSCGGESRRCSSQIGQWWPNAASPGLRANNNHARASTARGEARGRRREGRGEARRSGQRDENRACPGYCSACGGETKPRPTETPHSRAHQQPTCAIDYR